MRANHTYLHGGTRRLFAIIAMMGVVVACGRLLGADEDDETPQNVRGADGGAPLEASTATGDSSPSTFCANVDATLCSDWDDERPVTAGWTATSILDGGLTRSTAASRSAPASLLVSSFGGASYAELDRELTARGPVVDI